ncbi:MAG TPA: BamA/TamA family outer membrane protein, partial [Noviherbaspirillum sp.]
VPGYNDSPELYKRYVTDFGDGTTATTHSFPLTIAWQRDSRDSTLVPTVGRYQRVNLEVAPAGSLKYYRAIYQHQWFKPLSRTMTLALNGEVDYGHGLEGKRYPIFKNFYAGGIGSVRGYDGSSLGPRALNGDPLGGTTRIIGNAELQLPFPGSGADRTLRWFTFLDGGNVYAEGQKVELSQLRYAAGIGVSWVSPIGPLKLSYGKALNAKPDDRTQTLQFQLGTGF